MSSRSLMRLRSALALLAIVGVLLRAVLPGVATAAPATIEALTGTVLCAHDAQGGPTPAPNGHTGHGNECCTAACAHHAAFGLPPAVSYLVATREAFAIAAPRPASDARAPRPPPRTFRSPRGPPTLV